MSSSRPTKSIEELITMYDNGKLLLPEFQRDFKWPLEKSETLFDSIFKDLFIGSLILSKPQFDLACKKLDLRERGSKKRRPIPKKYTEQQFEIDDIYTILDGQQRATSIYRTLKGPDVVNLLFKDVNTLLSDEFYDYENKRIKVSYDEYVDGFDSSKPDEKTLFISLKDLYQARNDRETPFLDEYINPILDTFSLDNEKKEILRDFAIQLKSDFNSSILKQKTLISVQLLDMSIEKFCLYFERSNSQGLTLSFTDIITAKVYTEFNLRSEIDKAVKTYTYFNEKLVDSSVRYINYVANDAVTKKSILKDLNGTHFNKYWSNTVKDLSTIQGWLIDNNWLFNVEQIPYRSMLLPILSFYQNLKHKEFSQASQKQLDLLKFWFYGSILDTRYGGARHGSTNVVIKEDCDVMKNLAQNKFPANSYWQKIRIDYSFDELKKIDSKSNAKFMALNYYMYNKTPFKNLNNFADVSFTEKVDVHHIFPSDYLESEFGKDSAEFDFSDSILNKVRINKIENIKISNKPPKTYLGELKGKNKKVKQSLNTHYMGDTKKLIDGDYDLDYFGFLKNRFDAIEPLLLELKNASEKLSSGISDNLWKNNKL
ncbi:GmrSD restriction endonuclease domain-containing protein [Polaribacter sp. P097]|uniref:GmrSD restriction endonuclease domain-containing protein n=1 Tax=Polaribacter sp. P097 TaxID=3117398 RepID=UPI002FE3FB02